MLRLREAAWEQLYWLKHLTLEHWVSNDGDGLLEHIIAELMGDKSLYDLVHTELRVPWLATELPNEDLIIPEVSAIKDLLNLIGSLSSFETLFDHVWWEFKLA